MTPDQQDDTGLLEAFRAGDARALADLYARWSPLVYSLALRSLLEVGRAEEVTRQVFVRAWEARATVDPTRTRFPSWLLDLARERITGSAAASGVSDGPREAISDEESAEAESKTGVLAERLIVADGLSRLDSLPQRVLRMALDHDLTLAEIAGRTGLRLDEVKSHIATGLVELRQRLEVQVEAH